MTNNDILRQLRFVFDFKDHAMVKLFAMGGLEVTIDAVSRWLKKEDHDSFVALVEFDRFPVDDNLNHFQSELFSSDVL